MLPPNRFQGYLRTIRSVDKRNPPNNQINKYFAQKTFAQRSPKGKQNEIVVYFMVVLFKRTRGPGEKKHKR